MSSSGLEIIAGPNRTPMNSSLNPIWSSCTLTTVVTVSQAMFVSSESHRLPPPHHQTVLTPMETSAIHLSVCPLAHQHLVNTVTYPAGAQWENKDSQISSKKLVSTSLMINTVMTCLTRISSQFSALNSVAVLQIMIITVSSMLARIHAKVTLVVH